MTQNEPNRPSFVWQVLMAFIRLLLLVLFIGLGVVTGSSIWLKSDNRNNWVDTRQDSQLALLRSDVDGMLGHNALLAQYEIDIDQLETKIAALETAGADQQTQQSEQATAQATLQTSLAEQSSEVDTLSGNLADVQLRLNLLEAEVQTQRTDLDTLGSSVADVSTSVANLQEAVAATETADLTAVEHYLAVLHLQQTVLQARVAFVATEYDEAAALLTQASEEVETLRPVLAKEKVTELNLIAENLTTASEKLRSGRTATHDAFELIQQTLAQLLAELITQIP